MKHVSIVLDEKDLQKLKEWFNTASDDEAVQYAVYHVLNKEIFNDLLELEGKVKWEGNLDEMRADR
ncbi:MAG: hypothetical protein BAA01_09080 [Bacillus thermozeamaize]|jgi:site-specific DNA-adenine methylase|uniref:Uncharacterized protein n=1 Tax=Bacillus thermozeamaize TaxID=230954 RepID=A0A1Y3PIM6_9BACI|nr:MAG: hypothetical protein BAA01_09080 [Bacillus thermozeamaize]